MIPDLLNLLFRSFPIIRYNTVAMGIDDHNTTPHPLQQAAIQMLDIIVAASFLYVIIITLQSSRPRGRVVY